MANGQTQRTSDQVNWQLAGLRNERQRIEERLKYLHEEERRLTSTAMTGTHKVNGKHKTKKAPVRKRTLTPETRQKMAESAKKRWAERKSSQAAATSPVPPPVE